MSSAVTSPVESLLKAELTRADRALGGVAPVLGHLLAGPGHSLVSDAVVARVRGMLNDLARQFTARLKAQKGDNPASEIVRAESLAAQLAEDAPILAYLHAVATEALLTETLEQRAAIDPVLTPLSQELIASEDPVMGEMAMQALAAQSRFIQGQRRMQQPATELAPEPLERALRIWARSAPVEQEPAIMQAMRVLKSEYDEAQTRAGLLARLVASLRGGVVAALELEHAGFALFASALAHSTGQDRERAVLACHAHQAARLVLSLRAAGLDTEAVERQFVTLEPAHTVPRSLNDLSFESARAMLDDSALRPDLERLR
ncbi:MAG: hypothetical protein AAF291_15485 [Pseudomonadota bacterium]